MNLKENISLAYWKYALNPIDTSKLIFVMFFFMTLLLLVYIFLSMKENS
ncbi:hypothetical protein [Oceanirhabdus seepicola]|uniref:Uncharacterized protein n=1 Tax=Oceanirhabdus seepicola TaxID=2828781 RepID=A0A9J6NYA4_9CLOT|nr:hypothetical protein [Oceanirhabdus seepicola]MCM1988621.1 hypothetical protein [Oceanirhabdus seepicola]